MSTGWLKKLSPSVVFVGVYDNVDEEDVRGCETFPRHRCERTWVTSSSREKIRLVHQRKGLGGGFEEGPEFPMKPYYYYHIQYSHFD